MRINLIAGNKKACRAAFSGAWFAAIAITALGAVGVELDRVGRFNPRIAPIVPEVFQGEALENLVRGAIERGDNAKAEALAYRLVERRPIPAEGLSLYANALVANGKETAATAVLQAAAGRGWRDRFVQRIVILSALQQGTPDIAAKRVAGLWRLGERADWLKDLTRATLEAPGGLTAFEDTLIERDSYASTDFLSWAVGSMPLRTVNRLTQKIAIFENHFNCRRFSGRIGPLIREGNFESALAVWSAFCTVGPQARSEDLRFTSEDTVPGPLNWRYPKVPGININISQGERNAELHYSSSEPLLRVIARRFILLSSGRHVLRISRVSIFSKYTWGVNCISAGNRVIAVKLEPVGSGLWSFRVPASCPVQELRIAVRSGSGDIGRIEVFRTDS